MHARDANLLGALALGISDLITEAAAAGAGHGAMAPAALAGIGSAPGQSIDSLSRALQLSHSGAVRLIDRLESDGLVERRPGQEGRTVALHLTRAGKKALAEVQEQRQHCIAAVVGVLSASERIELTRLVEKLLAAMVSGGGSPEFICRLCEFDACPEHLCPVEREIKRLTKARDQTKDDI